MKNAPAFNALLALACCALFLSAVGSAHAGEGNLCFASVLLCIGCSLFIDRDYLVSSWEQPALVEQGVEPRPASTVQDHCLAWSAVVGNVELFHCLGTPEAYTGLDAFGNLLAVEDGFVTGYVAQADIENPLAA